MALAIEYALSTFSRPLVSVLQTNFDFGVFADDALGSGALVDCLVDCLIGCVVGCVERVMTIVLGGNVIEGEGIDSRFESVVPTLTELSGATAIDQRVSHWP